MAVTNDGFDQRNKATAMRRLWAGGYLLSAMALASGCGETSSTQPTAAAPAPAAQASKQLPVSATVNPTVPTPPSGEEQAAKKPPERAKPKQREVARAEAAAMKAVTSAIRSSMEIGPTLVVWILDSTSSARDIVHEISAAAANFYESPEAIEWSAAQDKPLLTAIVAFDEEVQFVADPPTPDANKAREGFESIRTSSGGREMTFTAIKQALEKYLPLRTRDRRELMLVVVTDEAGDDANLIEQVLEPARKQAIPIYTIGLPAPWGQTNPFAANPKAGEPSKDDSIPTVGPESLLSERVDIDHWAAKNYSANNVELIDSGFGPFALERLCRASRGRFFALRPGLGYGYRSVNARVWPNGNELRFEESVVSRYTPDYVSEDEYRKLLGQNKACAAVVEAARLPKVVLEGTPGSHFPKDVEAKMAKQMSAAQQFAARNLPPVDHLHEILIKGESDRAKLTSPRWQAEFDLAIGRVLANKARLDGYNSMIAALKRGKNFQNPESKAWQLNPADNFETESTIKKTADKAKMYLERVINDHPGTPWLKVAEEELKLPLGWSWEETKDSGPEVKKVKGKKGK
jgi:hypothetical protein